MMGEPVVNKIKEAAEDYIRRGWKVFPVYGITSDGVCACHDGAGCNSPGKHPRVGSWTKESTLDVKQVSAWWSQWPSANIGLVCGRGMFVLDVDDGKGGTSSLEKLLAEHDDMPETRMHATGNGYHLLFTCGEDIFIPNSVSKIGPGLDVRGDGGYVVAPPSLHVSGAFYQVELGFSEDPSPAPSWLIDLAKEEISGSTGGEAAKDEKVTLIKGERNNYFTSLAGTMRRRGIGLDAIKASLIFENKRRCSPPLPEAEIVRLAEKSMSWTPDMAASMEKAPGIGLDEDWRNQVRWDNNKPTKDQHNIALILSNHNEWKGVLAWDEMSYRVVWHKLPPNNGGVMTVSVGDAVTDNDEVLVQAWFAMRYQMEVKKESALAGIQVAARNNTVHPVRSWLKTLKWDGTARVENWLADYTGAAGDRYTKLVGTYWLVSAVARVMRPGCQVDHVLVLEGAQGEGKSTGMAMLFGDEWYLPTLPNIDNKDALQILNGKWCAEIAELDSFRGKSHTKIKDFISQRYDVYRPSYGRYAIERKRQCVFLGTTNEERYLNDPTGARRFWPVTVGFIERERILADREQLWAEAYKMFRSGTDWWPDREMSGIFAEAQEERFQVDAWENLVACYLKGRDETSIGEVLKDALSIHKDKWSKADQCRVGYILKRLHWAKRRTRVNGVRLNVYYDTRVKLPEQPADDPDY